MNISRAILYLYRNEGLVLPYGYPPGSFPGGINSEFDETTWGVYQWNPPQHIPNYDTPDPEASPKPTWAKLVESDPKAVVATKKQELLNQLGEEARRRITRAYGVRDWNHEIQLRLRGSNTTEQDQERDRLRAVHATLEAQIKSASSTQTLEELNLTDDTVWVE